MDSIAVFPATFDPITNGHLAIAERAARLFDRLVIGVYNHPGSAGNGASFKQPLFSADERVSLVRASATHLENLSVRRFDGLAIDFAREEKASAIVRGLRVADDFEFERQMAMMNRHLAPEVETLLLISEPGHAFVSASIVREVALMGGDVSQLVPPLVADALEQKTRQLRRAGRVAPRNLA